MPRIPGLDPNATRLPEKLGPAQFNTQGMDAGFRGLADVGATITNIAGDQLTQLGNEQREREAQDRALADIEMRSRASEHELRVTEAEAEHTAGLTEGRYDFRDNGEAWQTKLSEMGDPELPKGLDPVQTARFQAMVTQNKMRATAKVNMASTEAKRKYIQTEIVSAMDKTIQVAGATGKTEEGLARLEELRPGFRAAGNDEAITDVTIRKARQQIWLNEAKTAIEAADDSEDALNGVLHNLTGEGGRYVAAIEDPNVRLNLASAVRNRIGQLQAGKKQEVDKREALAASTVSDVWKQAGSGVLPTPDMLTNWSGIVGGTSKEAEYQAAIHAVQDVQTVLREGPTEQAEYVQGLWTALAGGGTPEDKKRILEIEGVIEASNKQRSEQPLLWLQSRLGKPTEPLDFAGMLQSGDSGGMGAALAGRMADITTMRQTYGPSVPMTPLLPQEAKLLSQSIDILPADKLNNVFPMLRSGMSEEAYNAVMEQIAPNAPVKAYAGQIAVRPGGEKTAFLMLRGEQLLRSKDGAPKFPMPPDANFKAALIEATGAAYAGRDEAFKRDVAALRAVYAATMADNGSMAAGVEYDDNLGAAAISAVVGEVAEYGGQSVIPPWGVPAETFEEKADLLVSDALAAAGVKDRGGVHLVETPRPGTYLLFNGRVGLKHPTKTTRDGEPMPLYIDYNAGRVTPTKPKAPTSARAKALGFE